EGDGGGGQPDDGGEHEPEGLRLLLAGEHEMDDASDEGASEPDAGEILPAEVLPARDEANEDQNDEADASADDGAGGSPRGDAGDQGCEHKSESQGDARERCGLGADGLSAEEICRDDGEGGEGAKIAAAKLGAEATSGEGGDEDAADEGELGVT